MKYKINNQPFEGNIQQAIARSREIYLARNGEIEVRIEDEFGLAAIINDKSAKIQPNKKKTD